MTRATKFWGMLAYWVLFISVLGPFLISDDSYELPIIGGVLFIAGVYLTYRAARPSTKKVIL